MFTYFHDFENEFQVINIPYNDDNNHDDLLWRFIYLFIYLLFFFLVCSSIYDDIWLKLG